MNDQTWYVYIVRNNRGSLYCGITTDVKRRVHEHNNIKSKAAKAVWPWRPAKLVWSKKVKSRSKAATLEAKIKKLPPKVKSSMIGQP
jgi:putative endonuclease